MDTKIRADWIAALRSGDYEQGKGQLRETADDGTTTFCCLGVLCNLHAIANPKIAAKELNTEAYFFNSGYLSPVVEAWAGIDGNGGEYGPRDLFGTRSLANDNDNGKSFKQIALIIERNF